MSPDLEKWAASHPDIVAAVSGQLSRHSPYCYVDVIASQCATRLALVQTVAKTHGERTVLAWLGITWEQMPEEALGAGRHG